MALLRPRFLLRFPHRPDQPHRRGDRQHRHPPLILNDGYRSGRNYSIVSYLYPCQKRNVPLPVFHSVSFAVDDLLNVLMGE